LNKFAKELSDYISERSIARLCENECRIFVQAKANAVDNFRKATLGALEQGQVRSATACEFVDHFVLRLKPRTQISILTTFVQRKTTNTTYKHYS
jgi:hypothetical protein